MCSCGVVLIEGAVFETHCLVCVFVLILSQLNPKSNLSLHGRKLALVMEETVIQAGVWGDTAHRS